MGTKSSDQLLVERVQQGDRSAFDILVVKYQHKVVKLVMRYVRDQAEALDVTQEAFLKAYRALPGFRGDSAFYPGCTGSPSIRRRIIWSRPSAGPSTTTWTFRTPISTSSTGA